MTDDDDLGARIAALGQPIELGQQLLARQAGLDDDQVRRRAFLVVRHGSAGAAHVHADVSLAEPAVLGSGLHRLRNAGLLAECLDRNSRNGPGALQSVVGSAGGTRLQVIVPASGLDLVAHDYNLNRRHLL